MLNWFLKADRGAEFVARWGTLAVMLSAVFSWLSKSAPWFGELNWPGAILLGIWMAILSLFVIAGALALFRIFKPLPSPSVDPSRDFPVLDHSPVDALRGELLQALSDRIGALKQGSSVAEAMDFADQRLATVTDRYGKRLDEIEAKNKRMIDDYQRMLAGLTEAGEEIAALKGYARQTRESFSAIRQREILDIIATEIERCAAELYDPLYSGESYDGERWFSWEETHKRWETGIRKWIDNGKWYAPEVEGRIYTVDDNKYGGTWSVTDSQFPGSEAVRRFKKFRIVHTQWQEVRSDVDNGVIQVAYVGLSEKDMQARRRPS